MSFLSLMKDKPSTFTSSILLTLSAFVVNLIGVLLFFFGVFILADAYINYMGIVDYLQALDTIRDEQLMKAAKRIRFFLGFSGMGLGILLFISTWFMRMIIHRNNFIDRMIDAYEEDHGT